MVSYEAFGKIQVTSFASNVERCATIMCGSFWITVLIFDKVLDNVQIFLLACKMQESEA